jgi:hypothetical protein
MNHLARRQRLRAATAARTRPSPYVLPVMTAAIADATACTAPRGTSTSLAASAFALGNGPEWGPAARGVAEAALARTRQRIAGGSGGFAGRRKPAPSHDRATSRARVSTR